MRSLAVTNHKRIHLHRLFVLQQLQVHQLYRHKRRKEQNMAQLELGFICSGCIGKSHGFPFACDPRLKRSF